VKNMRLGLAMVELVVAITVIGIALMSAPAVMGQISHSAYDADKSKQIEEAYRELSLQRAAQTKGTLSPSPKSGGFGHANITYRPLDAGSGETIRLVEYDRLTAESNDSIIMRAFGISTPVNRVLR